MPHTADSLEVDFQLQEMQNIPVNAKFISTTKAETSNGHVIRSGHRKSTQWPKLANKESTTKTSPFFQVAKNVPEA